MKNLKKKRTKTKMEGFLEKFPTVFLLQHTHFSVNDWIELKNKIEGISEKPFSIEILNCKNTLLKKSVPVEISSQIHHLLQGPCFLIGCHTENQSQFIWNSIKSHPKTLFISCLFHKKIFNHLDFEHFLKLNSSVYNDLLTQFHPKTEFSQILGHNFTFPPLHLTHQNFMACLSMVK